MAVFARPILRAGILPAFLCSPMCSTTFSPLWSASGHTPFYLRGTPGKTANLSNPGLCSADTSGPTLLSDSSCLISTPDHSSGTSSESQIKAQLGARACWHHHHPRPVYRGLSIPGLWCHEQKCCHVKGEVYAFISMSACFCQTLWSTVFFLTTRRIQEDEGGSHNLIPHAFSQYYCLPTAQDLQDLLNPDCGSSLYEQDRTVLGMCVMLASGCCSLLFFLRCGRFWASAPAPLSSPWSRCRRGSTRWETPARWSSSG